MKDINKENGPQSLTKEQLIKIANEHIEHFEKLIKNASHPNIRGEECVRYYKIWRAIKAAATDGYTYDTMKEWPVMRAEIRDAYYDMIS